MQPTPGPIVTNRDVEEAARDTLKWWLPYYLGRIDVDHGRAPTATREPRSYNVASEDDRWAEETPPSLIVVSPGTVDDPEVHGEFASYAATWQVNVGVTAGGATEKGSRELASRYAAAVRYVLVQQGDLGGLAQRTRWMGERYDIVARRRALMACEVLAHVRVLRTVDGRGPIPRVRPTNPRDPAAETPTPIEIETRVSVQP